MTVHPRKYAVILIDDNRLDLMVASRLIELAGLASQVTSYPDPKEALRNMLDAETSGDRIIVLLDIQMPGLDGFACMDQMLNWPEARRNRYHVYLLSSTLAEQDIQRAAAHPMANGLLSKPLDIPQLKSLLADLPE
jgi:CheY-like chemotaxis protein